MRIRFALLLASAISSRATADSEPPWLTEPRDFDADSEEYSAFWSRALQPDRPAYQQLVAQSEALASRSPKEAARLAKKAIALEPNEPDAIWLLGTLHSNAGEWIECAKVLGSLFRARPGFVYSKAQRWSLDHKLGVCLAQTGQYKAAAEQFKRSLSAGHSTPVLDRRIGETYMALGRLNDAIVYFERAKRANAKNVLLSLAVAYDRQGKTALSSKYAERAGLKALTVALRSYVLIPPHDEHYYWATAHRAGKPVLALLHYRHFVELAAKSPWVARAKEHIEEIERILESGATLVLYGPGKIDLDKSKAILAKAQPAFQKCLVNTPNLLLKVRVVLEKKGRTLRRGVRHERYIRRPGSFVLVEYSFDTPTDAIEAAVQCTYQVADGLAMPKLAKDSSYATLEFFTAKLP